MAEPACVVCDTDLSEGPTSCPKCGFPSALREDAVAAFRGRDPYVRPTNPAPPFRRSASPRASTPKGSSAAEPVAEEVDRTVALALKLGTPSEELGAEIRRAARAEMNGHPDEAVRILTDANARASEAIQSQFERRVHDLDARQAALAKEGLGNVIEGPMAQLQTAVQAHRLSEAAQILTDAEANVTRVAEELESLRVPLRDIDALLAITQEAGLDFPEERAKETEIRSHLTSTEPSRRDLTQTTERAEELRALLREKVPARLQQELDQHEGTLRPYPDDHPAAASARATHAQALDHLEGGRLGNAASSLKELRAAIAGLGPVPLPRVERDAPEEVEEAPANGVTIADLVQTARLLAARIRALDSQSSLAYEAATQIRLATDYLRARQLDEAAETLNQLMDTLDGSEAPPARSARP